MDVEAAQNSDPPDLRRLQSGWVGEMFVTYLLGLGSPSPQDTEGHPLLLHLHTPDPSGPRSCSQRS